MTLFANDKQIGEGRVEKSILNRAGRTQSSFDQIQALQNLTNDEAPYLVVNGKEQIEQWSLVRLTNSEATVA